MRTNEAINITAQCRRIFQDVEPYRHVGDDLRQTVEQFAA
jgi:hypothetical protein